MQTRKETILPYALFFSLLLAGCSDKVECTITNRHVHRYHKNITNNISIDTYLDKEVEDTSGYYRTDDYIEMTKQDETVFKLIESKKLFLAQDYYDYLYYLMSTKNDYLKFYYEYYTEECYITTNDDGETETHWERKRHDGWTSNPNNSDNTGETRLYHHRYYAYRIVLKDGTYTLEKSPNVDDIREVLDEYPYVSEDNCFTTVHETFYYSRHDLPDLDANDFNVFQRPNLDDNSKTYVKKSD